MSAPAPRVVVASVGTDHHPFHRLMDWLERWIADRPHIELLVQHGPAHPVVGAAQNRERLPQRDLLAWLDRADGVVLQGGPGGIIDALRLGHRPIVIPRLARHGEVVDDHQVAFCSLLDHRELVAAGSTYDDLAGLLDQPRHARQPGVDLTQRLASDGPRTIAQQLAERPRRLQRDVIFSRFADIGGRRPASI